MSTLWTCACGSHKWYDSGNPPARCYRCEKCGSNLAWDGNHGEPEGHSPTTITHQDGTGKVLCRRCMTTLEVLP